MKLSTSTTIFALLSCASSVTGAGHTAGPTDSITDIACNSTDFTTLCAALGLTGLDEALDSSDAIFTAFAPNDAAFEALQAFSPGTLEAMLAEDPPITLTDVLLYHVTPGAVKAADLTDGGMLPMLHGDNATLMATPPMIDSSNIIAADIEASNGVIHAIDFPMVPSTVTVLPSLFLVANATGEFTVLWQLLESVGLGDQLNTPGPLTVFAPTDEAFAKIPNLDEIVQDPQTAIAILTNHVVPGFFDAASLSDGQVLPTIVGGSLDVSITENGVMIEDSTVVIPNLIGSNGLVHGIDTVMIPEQPATDDNMATDPPADGSAFLSFSVSLVFVWGLTLLMV